MIIKIAACLLAVGFLAACQHDRPRPNARTLRSRTLAASDGHHATAQPAPPAEGPEDVRRTPAEDPNDNPGSGPSPLLPSLRARKRLVTLLTRFRRPGCVERRRSRDQPR